MLQHGQGFHFNFSQRNHMCNLVHVPIMIASQAIKFQLRAPQLLRKPPYASIYIICTCCCQQCCIATQPEFAESDQICLQTYSQTVKGNLGVSLIYFIIIHSIFFFFPILFPYLLLFIYIWEIEKLSGLQYKAQLLSFQPGFLSIASNICKCAKWKE